jgi:ribose-phosphate pyrophosphokinase
MKYFVFSGGEVHCKVGKDADIRLVCWDYTMNGFMAVCEYNEVLKRQGLHPHLIYPYFPYARQDRVMQPDEPFSLKIFCDMVNGQNFKSVAIHDPHSDVTPALLNNCIVIPQWELAQRTLPQEYISEYLFVSPDAGAYKKVSKLISDDKRIAIGVKNRDSQGNITHTDVFSPVPIEGQNCVIVDDICDGGRTFIELAKTLKDKGADSVILYVTHGIFSKGIDVLKEHIDHVYTTNSFPNISTDYLTVKEF